jgi:hypothetical protein
VGLASSHAMPAVLLAPYIPLRTKTSVGPWDLIPFADMNQAAFMNDAIAEDARMLVTAYRVTEGRLGALLVPSGSPVGTECDPESLRPLRRALLLGILEANPKRPENPEEEAEDPNAGHRTAAAENALVYGHPVRGDGTFATQSGFMAPFLALHGRLQPTDTISIAHPGELPTPIMAADLDSDYASAALSVMSEDGDAARRVLRATEWLDVAWQNASTITHDTRILALRSGFEVLLSTTEFGDDPLQIRDALVQLLDEPGAQKTTRSWTQRGRLRSDTLTDLEWWFQSFTVLRNAIAHGHDVSRRDSIFEDGRLHLLIAERTLRRAIKRTIARAGHPDVELDATTRLLQRLVREQQRRADTNTSDD